MSDKLSIAVEVTGAQQGAEALGGVKDKLEEIREEARKVFAKGLSESLPEQLQDAARGFSIAGDKTASWTTRLQAGVGAALITKNAVVDLAGRVVELSRAFGEAAAAQDQHDRALRTLGDTYASVRASTAGTASATDALALRQSLLRQGFEANSESMARIARLGREYSQTWGGTATEATNAFISAIRSGDAEALQPFGIRIEQGKTSAQRMSAALEQLAGRYSGLVGPSARTAAEDNAVFERGLTRMRDSALAGLNTALLGIPGGLRSLATWLGNADQAQQTLSDDTERASRGLERQAEAARTAASATASLTEELSKADRQLKEFEQTLQEAPSYTLGANEGYQDAVSRASQQALNAIGRSRAQRRLQRSVRRSLGRGWTAADLAAAGLPPDAPPDLEAIRRAMEAAARRKRVDALTLAGMSPEQGDAADAWAASLGATRADMASQNEAKRREQLTYEAEQNVATNERSLSFARGVSEAGESRVTGFDAYQQQQQDASFGGQINRAFTSTRTHAERTADSVKSSFDTMTQGLTSWMDTLIESPEKAGEASVALAKNVLKGLAMMALQNSLFETAAGIADAASLRPTAAGHFAAAGIYAGVAIAAGAGAAGIAAGQRGAQAAPPSNNGGGGFGPARADGGRSGNREAPMYTIMINGSVLDGAGFEDAVGRAVRGLERSGRR